MMWIDSDLPWEAYCAGMIADKKAVMVTAECDPGESEPPHLEMHDSDGNMHCTDDGLPSYQARNGMRMWHTHGELDRENGPAIVSTSGFSSFYKMGLPHCTTGPAKRNLPNGPAGPRPDQFYINGKRVDPF